MCFSATASFVTAGMTAAVGMVALSRISQGREAPMAAIPLLFALQQALEGLLWLALPSLAEGSPVGAFVTIATFLYLVMAEVFWPVYMPLAVLLLEPQIQRRGFMVLCLTVGVSVAGYLLWWIVTQPYGAVLQDGHIVYRTSHTPTVSLALSYLAATCLPLLLSSHRAMIALGAVILVGSAVAVAFYWEGFVSVWCFFAAAASLVVLGHFEWSRRQRLRLAGA